MSSAFNSMLAQLNAGPSKAADGAKAEPKKKPAAKRNGPSKSTSSSGAPAGSDDSSQTPANQKVKLKLKGTGTGYSSATARPSNTAAAIASASTLTAAPLDPTTAPLSKKVKDVLDCLLQRNGSQLTASQIQQLTGHNLDTDSQLLREIHQHPRITYQGAPYRSGSVVPQLTQTPSSPAAWYSYLPEIAGVRDKTALLNYVRDNKGPAVLVESLKLCYLSAAEDIRKLQEEGKIFIIGHPEKDKETVFVRDMAGQEIVEKEVRDLWFEVTHEHVANHVPQGLQELQAAVVKAGLRSALANQPVKRLLPGAPKERAKKQRQQRINIEKATNAHLPFLFAGAQPKMLDS